jgi:hypothetical protein
MLICLIVVFPPVNKIERSPLLQCNESLECLITATIPESKVLRAAFFLVNWGIDTGRLSCPASKKRMEERLLVRRHPG